MTQNASSSPSAVPPTIEEISAAAADVNSASNELGKAIEALENFLAVKNIGVPAWVRVKGWENPDGQYWRRELGYDRFENDWHIGIRETHGHEAYPEHESVYRWQFNNSPRKARISSADKLPELLNELIKEATRTARRLRDKSGEVRAFAATLIPPSAKRK